MKALSYIFLTLAIIGTICVITIITTCLLGGCQPKDDLKGLNCPCDVISAELTYNGHKVTYIDKDGKEQTVISKALYDQYQKKKQ